MALSKGIVLVLDYRDRPLRGDDPFEVKERMDLSGVRCLRLESHHGVPKEVQNWLGMSKNADDVPAYLTTMLEHRGAEVGIHQRLAKKMGDLIGEPPVPLNQARRAALTDDLIRQALEETYEEAGLGHFWRYKVTDKLLMSMSCGQLKVPFSSRFATSQYPVPSK